jgi:fucose permease
MFIALLGLANSLMWPSIWPLAITELGRFTKIGSSMMVMAISGAAVIPLLYGRIADLVSPKQATGWRFQSIFTFCFMHPMGIN